MNARQINIIIISLLTLLLHIIPEMGQAQTNYSDAVNKKIQEVENNLSKSVKVAGERPWNISERMQGEYHNVQGISIAVIDNYEIQWAKAYGWADGKNKIPATTATRFQAASISKSLNAVGILKLVAQNKMSLDEDINNILQSWKFPYDEKTGGKKINVKQLLSHTAGISSSGFNGYKNAKKLPSFTDILDGKGKANSVAVRSLFEPGSKFQYSGGGIVMTQLMVEDITNASYEEYIAQNILSPLSMNNSFYKINKNTNLHTLSSGHWYNGDRLKNKYQIYPEHAPSGLWTTPTDLAKFVIALQQSLAGTSEGLLSKEMAKLMLSPVLENNSNALGAFIVEKNGVKYFHHSGSNEGFTCHYYGSMEGGKGVVVMTNSESYHIISEILNSVATVYDWENFCNPTIRTIVEVKQEELIPLLGTYQFESGNEITIGEERGTLFLSNAQTNRVDMYPESNRFFFFRNADDQIEFVEVDGKIELNFYRNGKAHRAVRKG